MEPDRWRRIQQMLDQSLALPVEEREAYLAEVCSDDPSLVEEVRSLLAHVEHDDFLEKPAAQWLASAEWDDPSGANIENLDGRQVGSYRVIREIGHGGMGVVYEAEQQEPVRRKVALKVIKSGMDTEQVLARFNTERQALAQMSHPTIARVFDAGTTPNGRPYFSMELIAGVPITEYCDHHLLSVHDRLELFIQVCHGIHHAHQKGIIHRDIKPSNVLVTVEDGAAAPKIIDFGVAKATARGVIEVRALTEVGQLIGTPAYMSPEQAHLTNADIDTRSDVYSLGALLFEILVGAAPLDSHNRPDTAFDEMLRTIREKDRPAPTARLSILDRAAAAEVAHHRRTDVASLARELRGDLDWIVTKALSRERELRYGAASELAADILRHLRNEPIVASPPGAAYRVRKFVRRHRVGVISGGVVAVAMVLAIAGTTVGMVRATRAQQRASREAATAQAINRFLQETLGAANPEVGLGKNVTVIEALDNGLQRVEEIFADEPEIEAAVRNTVGNTYRILGRLDEAEAQLRMALAIRERELGPEHLDVAASLSDMGLLHQERGDPAGAEALYRRALTIQRRLLGTMHPDLATSLNNLAGALMQSGRDAEAEPLLREVVAMYRKGLGDEDPLVALGLHSLGGALEGQGRYDEAEALFRESLAIVRRQLPDGHPGVAYSASSLANLLRLKGECEQAEPYFLESIEVFQEALGPGHWREGVNRGQFGECLTKLARFEEAEEQLLKADSILQAQWEDVNQTAQMARRRLRALYEAWGKPERASEYR